jgi:hypothetical protein
MLTTILTQQFLTELIDMFAKLQQGLYVLKRPKSRTITQQCCRQADGHLHEEEAVGIYTCGPPSSVPPRPDIIDPRTGIYRADIINLAS